MDETFRSLSADFPVLDVPEREAWMDLAVCAQVDPEFWFPEKGGSTRQAMAICNGTKDTEPCEVREQCLLFALAHDERFGIWGGRSERERRRIRRTRREFGAAS